MTVEERLRAIYDAFNRLHVFRLRDGVPYELCVFFDEGEALRAVGLKPS